MQSPESRNHDLRWTGSLEPLQRDLVLLAYHLLEREESTPTKHNDYSFIVFPMAKAYEGYLKVFLKNNGLISEEVFKSRKFRIGRALNPDVSPGQRDEQWLYDDVTRKCGVEVGNQLWTTWLECRNHVFHYFPTQLNTLSLTQAREYLAIISQAIQSAEHCIT